MLAHLRHLGVVFNVVVAVGQRQSTLVNIGDDLIGIMQVRRRIEVEQRIRPDQVHAGDGIDQRTFVLCGGDAIQFRLERVETFGIDCLLVHACAVVVANLLVNRAAAWPASGSLLQNVP